MEFTLTFLVVCSVVFFCIVGFISVKNFGMFTKAHGLRHGMNGLAGLIVLMYGFLDVFINENHLYMDMVLGITMSFLPFTALVFGHDKVKNISSGALDVHATVTRSEMIEHFFYQLLNFVHIVYLTVVASERIFWKRIVYCFIASCFWLFRGFFPINRFSDNYTKLDPKSTSWIRLSIQVSYHHWLKCFKANTLTHLRFKGKIKTNIS